MTKSVVAWPSSVIASAISRAGLALGAPDLEELPHPVVHPVDGGAGLAQRRDLVDCPCAAAGRRSARPRPGTRRRGSAC